MWFGGGCRRLRVTATTDQELRERGGRGRVPAQVTHDPQETQVPHGRRWAKTETREKERLQVSEWQVPEIYDDGASGWGDPAAPVAGPFRRKAPRVSLFRPMDHVLRDAQLTMVSVTVAAVPRAATHRSHARCSCVAHEDCTAVTVTDRNWPF